MNLVVFVDTSVLVNLLNIPYMNERLSEANQEYARLTAADAQFVIPAATLIETGNHIAHISDGNTRYKIGTTFANLIKEAVDGNSTWIVAAELSQTVLQNGLDFFIQSVSQGIGIGDSLICTQFDDFWKNKQPIGTMQLWSFDKHLQMPPKEGGLSRRKNL